MMSPLEIVAVALALITMVLIIKRSVWNYPFAIAMVTCYFFILRDAKLYSDAGLQIFFVLVNIYGWWSWYRQREDMGEIVVERLSCDALLAWIAGSVLATLAWGFFMSNHTDGSYPFWDASVAMLSVTGQILMTRRYLENWHWWIVVNILSVPLYYVKGLYLTSGLYMVYLVLAVAGLIEWRKVSARQIS
jgi:nicotinamide mononucleotide transporter